MTQATHSATVHPALLTLVGALTLSAAPFHARAEPLSHADELPRHGPPPEAFAACEGKSEGDECSVSFRDKTLAGVCVAPGSSELFCMPNDVPEPPPGGPGARPPRE